MSVISVPSVVISRIRPDGLWARISKTACIALAVSIS